MDELLVVHVNVLDGFTWLNTVGIWLSKFFNIILLKKESWAWSHMLKASKTNIFNIQLVSAAKNCKTILLYNDK